MNEPHSDYRIINNYNITKYKIFFLLIKIKAFNLIKKNTAKNLTQHQKKQEMQTSKPG